MDEFWEFRELVGIAIGEASMCWGESPKGVFESTRAAEIAKRIVEAHIAEAQRLRINNVEVMHLRQERDAYRAFIERIDYLDSPDMDEEMHRILARFKKGETG